MAKTTGTGTSIKQIWITMALTAILLASAGFAIMEGVNPTLVNNAANVAVTAEVRALALQVNESIQQVQAELTTNLDEIYYTLKKPCSYIISVANGSSPVYCLQNGTTGALTYSNAHIGTVCNSATGNLTGGGLIVLRTGIYNFTGEPPIQIKYAGITFTGESTPSLDVNDATVGNNGTILIQGSSDIIDFMPNPSYYTSGYLQGDHIANILFVGGTAGSEISSVNMTAGNSTYYLTIDHCVFDGSGQTPIILMNFEWVTIHDCNFLGCAPVLLSGTMPLDIYAYTNGYQSGELFIYNNEFYPAATNAIAVLLNAVTNGISNVQFSGNHFEDDSGTRSNITGFELLSSTEHYISNVVSDRDSFERLEIVLQGYDSNGYPIDCIFQNDYFLTNNYASNTVPYPIDFINYWHAGIQIKGCSFVWGGGPASTVGIYGVGSFNSGEPDVITVCDFASLAGGTGYSLAHLISFASSGYVKIFDNPGYNPLGPITNYVASGLLLDSGGSGSIANNVMYTNIGSPKNIFITGGAFVGAASNCTVSGSVIFINLVTGPTMMIHLEEGDTIRFNWTSAPTLVVKGD
jgi:hypothetical protein